jgi:hypothetical protein
MLKERQKERVRIAYKQLSDYISQRAVELMSERFPEQEFSVRTRKSFMNYLPYLIPILGQLFLMRNCFDNNSIAHCIVQNLYSNRKGTKRKTKLANIAISILGDTLTGRNPETIGLSVSILSQDFLYCYPDFKKGLADFEKAGKEAGFITSEIKLSVDYDSIAQAKNFIKG